MKYTLHVPVEQYGFVALEYDSNEDRYYELKERYDSIKAVFAAKEGLEDKAMNSFIDRQLNGESNHIEDYNKMSDKQQFAVQTIKRALKRIEAREEK
jgi:hypothetical protein